MARRTVLTNKALHGKANPDPHRGRCAPAMGDRNRECVSELWDGGMVVHDRRGEEG